MKILKFHISAPPYYPGDVAGFEDKKADSFVKRNIAVELSKEEITALKNKQKTEVIT